MASFPISSGIRAAIDSEVPGSETDVAGPGGNPL